MCRGGCRPSDPLRAFRLRRAGGVEAIGSLKNSREPVLPVATQAPEGGSILSISNLQRGGNGVCSILYRFYSTLTVTAQLWRPNSWGNRGESGTDETYSDVCVT